MSGPPSMRDRANLSKTSVKRDSRICSYQHAIRTTLLALFLLMPVRTNAADKQIALVFRYDDFSNYSSSPLETAVLGLFKKHNLPVTIGVIPFSVPDSKPDAASRHLPLALMPERARFLEEGIKAGTFEVALHGYLYQRIDEANY